jgi:DNA-directed RNA polymerase specialized sigma24 family protein
MSVDEIAEETGLSPSSIRKYLSRSRKRLKKLLDSEKEGGVAE